MNHFNWIAVDDDPDNWVQIPEFGVRPRDVNFEGFALPIVTPRTMKFDARPAVFFAVKAVRREAARMFGSLQALRAWETQFQDQLMRLEVPSFDQWTEQDFFALAYAPFMENVAAVVKNGYGSSKHDRGWARAVSHGIRILTQSGPDSHAIAIARLELARAGARARHNSSNVARQWVRDEWAKLSNDFDNNKSEFARHYVGYVRERFNDAKGRPLRVTEKTMRDIWLLDAPSAGS